ncbi:helix-turn-helix domain-containing protein [Litchfieldia alkalitelluris]|nr:helix-turn-helix domain-containing protein [Litchfieldia alkalitelluris]
MLLNYKYEIFPTEEQAKTLDKWISICRMHYNSALLDKQRLYKS